MLGVTEHNFTLMLAGYDDTLDNELFEAGCDDATFGVSDGVAYADFDREAGTLVEAVLSAIADIESVQGIRVTRVEPEDWVTKS